MATAVLVDYRGRIGRNIEREGERMEGKGTFLNLHKCDLGSFKST